MANTSHESPRQPNLTAEEAMDTETMAADEGGGTLAVTLSLDNASFKRPHVHTAK